MSAGRGQSYRPARARGSHGSIKSWIDQAAGARQTARRPEHYLGAAPVRGMRYGGGEETSGVDIRLDQAPRRTQS
jgi:hypothetical protein